VLEPDIAKAFRGSAAVNDALRSLLQVSESIRRLTSRSTRPTRKRAAAEPGRYASQSTVHKERHATILIEAIAATKSTDGPKLANHIRKTKWKTALGPIRFDKKGDVLVSPFVVWEVEDGKFVEVK